MSQQQNVEDVQPTIFADDFDSGFDSGEGDFEPGGDGKEPGPGQGQSKSSRRRRRKRKNKVAGDGAPAAQADGAPAPVQQTIVMEGESLSLAGTATPAFTQAQPQAERQRRPQPQGGGSPSPQGGQQQPGQGQGKRWKKKFRDRERGGPGSNNGGGGFRSEGGGGSNNGGGGGGGFQRDRHGRPDNFGNLVADGGFKRKNKNGGGGKERGFVGPMDHSYRSESPDFNQAPPSTINLNGRRHGRHHGDSQPIDHNAPRPIPVPENAQTHIYFFIEELFLNAKISEAARKQGIKVAFVKNDKDVLAELTSGDEQNHPALIVFDLNNANAKPLTTIPKLKAKLKRGTSVIGFLSHLQGDLKAKAMEAGCDVVMPRAAFSQNLPNLLRRYGSQDEDEVNYNY